MKKIIVSRVELVSAYLCLTVMVECDALQAFFRHQSAVGLGLTGLAVFWGSTAWGAARRRS